MEPEPNIPPSTSQPSAPITPSPQQPAKPKRNLPTWAIVLLTLAGVMLVGVVAFSMFIYSILKDPSDNQNKSRNVGSNASQVSTLNNGVVSNACYSFSLPASYVLKTEKTSDCLAYVNTPEGDLLTAVIVNPQTGTYRNVEETKKVLDSQFGGNSEVEFISSKIVNVKSSPAVKLLVREKMSKLYLTSYVVIANENSKQTVNGKKIISYFVRSYTDATGSRDTLDAVIKSFEVK